MAPPCPQEKVQTAEHGQQLTSLCSLSLRCGLGGGAAAGTALMLPSLCCSYLAHSAGNAIHDSYGYWRVTVDVCRGSVGRDCIFLQVTAPTVPLHGPAAAAIPRGLILSLTLPLAQAGLAPSLFLALHPLDMTSLQVYMGPSETGEMPALQWAASFWGLLLMTLLIQ